MRHSVRGHIDFAVTEEEVKVCALCGRPPSYSWRSHVRVTPFGRYAVGGLVGVCSTCNHGFDQRYEWSKKNTAILMRLWRPTAPSCIQLIPKKPIQLVVRRRCNDGALATAIRETFSRIPPNSRRNIIDYSISQTEDSITGSGMRFEALGRWHGMGDAAGMNMDLGHAIRFRVSDVKKASPDDLMEIIAHEIAHTEQAADKMRFTDSNKCELDVEERLRTWGLKSNKADTVKRELVYVANQILEQSKRVKAHIRNEGLPSGNYASKAVQRLERALNNVSRALDSLHGE